MIFSNLFRRLFRFSWSIRRKKVPAEGCCCCVKTSEVPSCSDKLCPSSVSARGRIAVTVYGSSGTEQNYGTLDQVKGKLQEVGLESSNLIIGVDFTKSNEWTGKHCFNGRSLHHLGDTPNPYEQAIGIIGRTLSAYDEDNKIPCFGFGDTSTHDRNVFNFYRNGRACNGVSEALQRYREIAPHVRLSGPTSLAPIIETATRIVEVSRHQYHILLIIADGQVPTVTGCHPASHPDETTSTNHLEERTLQALIHASHFPLSIVLVGVGDLPWDDCIRCHDNRRLFDNFQFVDFTEIMSRDMSQAEKEDQFALEALRKIPAQYSVIINKWIREQASRALPGTDPLPPPC
ncbi:unnamed protein product [Urochloa decumbens]|uniref:Copine C-terminal domain-containing protein n=1 Tax=Urochloa decumbens TaxID=240449 RepID=A0ABC9G8L8_9POAL